MLIELFSLGAEALRANTDWKSAILNGGGSNFHVEGDMKIK